MSSPLVEQCKRNQLMQLIEKADRQHGGRDKKFLQAFTADTLKEIEAGKFTLDEAITCYQTFVKAC